MSKTHIIILLLPLLSLLAPAVSAQEENDLAMGQRALINDEVKAARKFLEKAYKANPSDTAAILSLAEACIRDQDAKRAEQVINSGLKLYPELPNLHLKMGIVHNLRARFKKAQESFEKANALLPENDPNRNTLYTNMGIAIQSDNRPLDALQWFDRSLEINPRNATAQGYRGTALYMIGDFEEAIKAYSTAIDIDSKNPIFYYNRGMAHKKNDDNAKACQDFHSACKMGNMNACKIIMVDCTKE